MQLIETTHFGWNELTHTNDCDRPAWEIDVRRDEGAHPLPHREDMRHSCTAENCSHSNVFSRVTVRVICRSCHTAHVISGEELGQSCTTTEALGYGQPPARVAGLYLWPGRAVLHGEGPGRSGWDDQPCEWLVTAHPVTGRLQREDCVGRISRWANAAHQTRWRADAVQVPLPGRLTAAEYGMAFARRQADLSSIDEAAEWIAAAQTQAAPVEVTV